MIVPPQQDQPEELMKLKAQVGTLTKRLQDLEDKNNEMAIEMAQRNETHDHMMKAILELEQELEKVKVASTNQ